MINNIPYFTFIVSPLCNDLADKIMSAVNGGIIYYLKLTTENLSSFIIKEGTHLFNYKSPLENLENLEDIPDGSIIYTIENSGLFRIEKDKYFAKKDGILILSNQLVKYIQINYDGFCEIEVSDDKTSATANIHPAFGDGKKLTESDIIRSIREKNISVHVELISIKEALDWVNLNNESLNNVIIAKGRPPKPGIDAWVEYLFNFEHKNGIEIDKIGHTDFYNLNLIESVSKDQKIAIFHPMVEGEDGFNIFGEKILAPKPKDLRPPKGQNYYYSEEEPTNILSKIDGYISLVGSEMVITNIYNIRGDVDFHTGHINCKGSLNVSGNVINGFNLNMSEDIKINGFVNDSEIITKGDVAILGGFTGTGKGIIDAGGNVCVRFIRNQTIHSRGSITVDKEIVDAQLFAKYDIKSKNNEATVIGGHLIAGGDIVIYNLGHEYEMTTIVEAGYDFDVIIQIKKINNTLEELRKELEFLKSQFAENTSKAFIQKYQEKKTILDKLVNIRNNLQTSLKSNSTSKIIVNGTIYPGVKINIAGHHIDVKEIMKSKVFSVSSDDEGIVISNK
ncbi:MAG: FapA family protein [Bacteroidetes bacterium]|nr:FapA family protein [Bacteroidota bacterium]MBU1114992.1 FapA family protein [Bacteroidota bacterium]MBU1797522.1 FapA family protein [Bacteroidota bacterium]